MDRLAENFPSLDRFINLNTDGNLLQIKPFLKNALFGNIYPKTMLELRGPVDTGKSSFIDFLIELVGKKNAARVSIDDLKNANIDYFKSKRLIIIYESLFDLTKREIKILTRLIEDQRINCLFVKISEVYGDSPKILPPELATPLVFKRSLSNNYLSELKYISEFELDEIRKWALGD